MSEEVKELKKELARRKRMASEIASEIHDIVEDTLCEGSGTFLNSLVSG